MGNASGSSSGNSCKIPVPTTDQETVIIRPVFSVMTEEGSQIVTIDGSIYPFQINLTATTLAALRPGEQPSSVCRALTYLLLKPTDTSITIQNAHETKLYKQLESQIVQEEKNIDYAQVPNTLFGENKEEALQLLGIFSEPNTTDEQNKQIIYKVVFGYNPKSDATSRETIETIYMNVAEKFKDKNLSGLVDTYITFPKTVENPTGEIDYVPVKELPKSRVSRATIEEFETIYLGGSPVARSGLASARSEPTSQVPFEPENFESSQASMYRRFVNEVFNTPEKVADFYRKTDKTKALKNAAVLGAVGTLGALAYNKRDDIKSNLSSLWTSAKGKVCTPADLEAVIQKLEVVVRSLDGTAKTEVLSAIDQLRGIGQERTNYGESGMTGMTDDTPSDLTD